MYEFSRLPCLSGLYRASAGASSSELKILRCKIESEDLQGEGPGWGDRCWACGFRVAGSWLCVLGFRVKGIEAPVVPERDCSSLHKTSSADSEGFGFRVYRASRAFSLYLYVCPFCFAFCLNTS